MATPTAAESSSAAATNNQHDEDDPYRLSFDPTTQFAAPSHVDANGQLVYLPPPTERERIHFWEQAIERHGLLRQDLERHAKQQSKEDDEEEKKQAAEQTKKEADTHPLAAASGSLQAAGINELNRAINLNSLVMTGEYFGLTNIVADPSLSAPATDGADTAEAAVKQRLHATEQAVKAEFVMRGKQAQFQAAAGSLLRHRHRLAAALVAQQQVDRRWRALRPRWRVCAPEHGHRAVAHAVRPTETVAADVDVYGSVETVEEDGRLARGVPRYATLEWADKYTVGQHLQVWEEKYFGPNGILQKETKSDDEADAMDIDEPETKEKDSGEAKDALNTRAEPFAVMDAALGRPDSDFDPEKIPMLTLQLDVEKPSTGYHQSVQLEPITTRAGSEVQQDEQVFVTLQHSLFCAKLFQSIRREVAPETEGVGTAKASHTQSFAWLSGESDENYLPPPNHMCGDEVEGLTSLCVVYCHEGEVKVQLDSEYNLMIKLRDASSEHAEKGTTNKVSSPTANTQSGSHSADRLKILCRALLLHAQETFHQHSVKEEELRRARMKKKEPDLPLKVHSRHQPAESPRILQSCVSLGSKVLFEYRIRKQLDRIDDWLRTEHEAEKLDVSWMAVPIFDPTAYFTIGFRDFCVDAHLIRDQLTLTRTMEDGSYRKATLRSTRELNMYLRLALKRTIKRSST